MKKVKTEKVATEDALAEAKEDIQDERTLVQQQSSFTDNWQGKFGDLAKLAEKAGVDPQKIMRFDTARSIYVVDSLVFVVFNLLQIGYMKCTYIMYNI